MRAHPGHDDDAELFSGWRRGNRHAGAKLIERHFPAVYRSGLAQLGVSSLRDLATTPSVRVDKRTWHATLRSALEELPTDTRLLLELSYWKGMSVEELAQIFEVPPGTIKSRLARARHRLRAHLGEARFPDALATAGER